MVSIVIKGCDVDNECNVMVEEMVNFMKETVKKCLEDFWLMVAKL